MGSEAKKRKKIEENIEKLKQQIEEAKKVAEELTTQLNREENKLKNLEEEEEFIRCLRPATRRDIERGYKLYAPFRNRYKKIKKILTDNSPHYFIDFGGLGNKYWVNLPELRVKKSDTCCNCCRCCECCCGCCECCCGCC